MAEDGYKNEDTLWELYHEQGLTQGEIGEKFGVGRKTISYWFDKLGVEREPDPPAYKDEDELRWMHHDEGLSQAEIGEMFDVTRETIAYYLEKYDIKKRTIYGNGYSQTDLVRELRLVSNRLDRTPSIWDMAEHSCYSIGPYQNKFESYHDAVRMTGLEPNRKPLVNVNCDNCGTEIQKPVSMAERCDSDFCSRECKSQAGRTTVACAECGESFEEWSAKVESQENLFCSRDCWLEYITMDELGNEHSYGTKWRRETRVEVLERDGYECVICGISQEEHTEEYGKGLHVHHVRRAGDFDSRDESDELVNLVTMCAVHHRKWEGIPLRPLN